jgi:hypothetical protein
MDCEDVLKTGWMPASINKWIATMSWNWVDTHQYKEMEQRKGEGFG